MADAIDYGPLIKKLAQQGVTPEEISRQFGTPIDYVRQVLGLPDVSKQSQQTKKEPVAKKPPPYRPPTKKRPVVWTSDHQDWLEKAVADGMDESTIAERLEVPKTTISRKVRELKKVIHKDKLPPVSQAPWMQEWKKNNKPKKRDETDLDNLENSVNRGYTPKQPPKPKPKAPYNGDLGNLDLDLGNQQTERDPTTGQKMDAAVERKTKRRKHGIMYETMRSVVTKGMTDNLGILGGHIANRMFGEHDKDGMRKGEDVGDIQIEEKVDHAFDGLTHQITVATGEIVDSLEDTLSILKHMNLGDRYIGDGSQASTFENNTVSGGLHPEARKTVLGKLGMILKVLGIGGAALGGLGLGAYAMGAFGGGHGGVHDHVPEDNQPPGPTPETPPPPVPTGDKPVPVPPKPDQVQATTPEEQRIREKDKEEKDASEDFKELKFKAEEIEFKADKIIFNQKESGGTLFGGDPCGCGPGGSGEPAGGDPASPGTTPAQPHDTAPGPSKGLGDRNPDPRESAPKPAGDTPSEKLIDDHHGRHDDPPQQPHATRTGAPPSSSPSTQGPGGYSPPAPPAFHPDGKRESTRKSEHHTRPGDGSHAPAGTIPASPSKSMGGYSPPAPPLVEVTKTSGHAPPSPLSHPDVTKSGPFNLTPTWSSGSASGYDSTLDTKISDWSRSNKPSSSVLGSQHPHPISKLPGPGSDGTREGTESYTPPTVMQPTLGSRDDKVDTFQTGRANIDQNIDADIQRIMAPPPPTGGYSPPGPWTDGHRPPSPAQQPPLPPPVPSTDPVTKLPTNNGLVGGIGYGGVSAPIGASFFNRQYGGGAAPPVIPDQPTPPPPNPMDQQIDQNMWMQQGSLSGDQLNDLSRSTQVASEMSFSRSDDMSTSSRGGHTGGHGKSRHHSDPDASAHEMLGTYFHDHFANIEGLDPHTINWGIG